MWATVAAQPDLVEIVIDGELLNSSNYRTWKLHMRRNLKRQGLWGFLGKSSISDCHKDKKALEAIKMSCQPHMKAHILYAENAREAWEWLAESASSPTEDKERHDKMLAEAAKAKEKLNGVMKADLTGNNYKNWKFYVENVLASKYLWNVVVGIDNYRTRDYKEKNRHAERIIMESCGKERLPYIHGPCDAKKAWEKLAESVSAEAKGKYTKYSRLLHAVQRYGFREKHIDRNGRYWGSACEYFEEFPEAVVAEITEDGSTALHVAVMLGRVDFVKELLELMTAEQLEIKTRQGNALSVAAVGNSLEIVKMLVKKNPNLLAIQDQHGHIPLVISVINAGEDMVHYLYSVTPKKLYLKHDKCIATLVIAALRAELYDIVLEILGESGFIRHGLNDCGGTLLSVLAGRPSAFESGNQFGYLLLYQSLLYRLAGTQPHGPLLKALKTIVPGVRKPLDDKVKHYRVLQIVNTVSLLLTDLSPRELHKIGAYETIQKATSHGIVELFDRLAASNPFLLQSRDDLGRSLIQNAIIFRQQSIFQYISQMGQMYQSITSLDLSDNNVLHCAGFWVPSAKLDRVPGAALQMQRELQWFQEVERVVHPRYREMNNKDGLKPRDLFEQEHKKLKEKGATWMKDTSQACMLVTTLIATIMFAAAFTVPGGNDQITGHPIFLKYVAFNVFIISDAISLFSACTSMVIFFSLLTGRYAPEDFLESLPRRLMLGLLSLFISITTMIVAFGATLIIILRGEISWAYMPVCVLAGTPVFLFGVSQSRLFFNVLKFTYRGIFCRRDIYAKNYRDRQGFWYWH